MDGNPDLPGSMMAAESYNYTGGPPNQFGALSGGLGLGSAMGANGARMYMMGGLGTIEEEKHETQTSNYFGKDGDETDESNIQRSRVMGAVLDETQPKNVEFENASH